MADKKGNFAVVPPDLKDETSLNRFLNQILAKLNSQEAEIAKLRAEVEKLKEK